MAKKVRSGMVSYNWKWIFFLYLLIIIRLIVFKFPYQELKAIMDGWQRGVILEGLDSANFTPFRTIRMYIRYYGRLNSFENLFGNVLVFVPYGIFYPLAFPGHKRFLLFVSGTFLFVLGIEVFQLFSAFGAFDVDDILLNCLGAIIGYAALEIFQKLRYNTSRQ